MARHRRTRDCKNVTRGLGNDFRQKKALLEKIFIFGCVRKIEGAIARVTSDLEACYDRQEPNLYGLVEVIIGASGKVIKLIKKKCCLD